MHKSLFQGTFRSSIGLYLSILMLAWISTAFSDAKNGMREVVENLSHLFKGETIEQTQYEIDLGNGYLWVSKCVLQPKTGDFIATTGQLNKEAILAFENNKAVGDCIPRMGSAKIGDKFYTVNILTGKWEETTAEVVYRDLERFNYFTLEAVSKVSKGN